MYLTPSTVTIHLDLLSLRTSVPSYLACEYHQIRHYYPLSDECNIVTANDERSMHKIDTL